MACQLQPKGMNPFAANKNSIAIRLTSEMRTHTNSNSRKKTTELSSKPNSPNALPVICVRLCTLYIRLCGPPAAAALWLAS